MKLLLTGAFNYSQKQLEEIKKLGFDITFVQDERVPLDIDCSEFEAVVCNGLFLKTPIEKFNSLKFIQVTSAGLDRLPMEYIKENNICLKNARGVYSIPMAEWCICKILDIYKKSSFFYENQKKNEWNKNRNLLELNGKTATILGAGDIGTQIAKRLSAFDVEVIAVDIVKPKSAYYSSYISVKDIKNAISVSDIVIITLPLTAETRNMFNADMFSCMKSNSIIINLSRGGIIDENALNYSLDTGEIMSASLDVFSQEPLPKDSVLWNNKNILISPHNSFVSENNSKRMYSLILKNLKEYLV